MNAIARAYIGSCDLNDHRNLDWLVAIATNNSIDQGSGGQSVSGVLKYFDEWEKMFP